MDPKQLTAAEIADRDLGWAVKERADQLRVERLAEAYLATKAEKYEETIGRIFAPKPV